MYMDMHAYELTKNSRATVWLLIVSVAFTCLAFPVNLMSEDMATSDPAQQQTAATTDSVLPAPDNGYQLTGLNDYLAFAAENSPALKSAYFRWHAAMEKSGYAGALLDPTISFAYFIENVETRVGPQNRKLSFKQSIPWFGTLGVRKDIASQNALAEYQRFESEKLRILYRVKAAFYEYYFLGRDIALTSENLELLKFWESIARTKYKVGLKQHPDLIKSQLELGLLEDRLLTLTDQLAPTTARLRAVANLPDSVTLPIPDRLEVLESRIESDSILSNALKTNPDLAAIQHLIDREQAGVRLAAKASLPNFTVGIDYIETGPAISPDLDESGKDPWIVGVGINLPVWFGKNKAKKGEAKAKLKAAQYRFSDARNNLVAFTEEILFRHNDALRKMKLYRDGLIPKAEQSLNASYTAYQAGETDFLSVLDSQRQLLAFQLQYEKSKTELAKRKAELEMIIGTGAEQ